MPKRQNSSPTKRIFALRRAGQFDEGYALCRESFGDFSTLTDKWEVAAVGWTVIDLIKRDLAAGKDCADYFYDLMSLHIEDDELLAAHVERMLRNPELAQARTLAKDGRLDESDAVYRRAWESSQSREAAEGIAWNGSVRLCTELDKAKPDTDLALKLVQEYLELALFEPPERLRARMENCAAKLAKLERKTFSLLEYLMKTGGFSAPGYCYRSSPEDGVIFHDAVVQETAAKEAVDRLSGKLPAAAPEMKDFIEKHVEPAFEQYVCRYSIAADEILLCKLQLQLGKTKEAFARTQVILRRGVSLGPANELAADALIKEKPDKAAGFYAAAVGTNSKMSDISRCLAKLISLLVRLERRAEARALLDKAKADTDLAGKTLSKELAKLYESDVLQDIVPNESGDAVLERLSDIAQQVLLSVLPDIRGNFGRIQRVRSAFSEDGVEVASFALKIPHEGLRVVTVPPTQLKGFTAEPGTPIIVKGSFSEDSHFRILSVQVRESGTKWDCIKNPIEMAVEHVNRAQQILICRSGKRGKYILPVWLPENCGFSVKPGDILRVRLTDWRNSASENPFPIDADKVEQPASALVKPYCGTLEMAEDGGSGSVRNELGSPAVVEVPEAVLTAGRLLNGDRVTGKAIRQSNTWRAVEAIREGGEEQAAAEEASVPAQTDKIASKALTPEELPPWIDPAEYFAQQA